MKLDQDKELKKLLSLVSSKLSTDRRYLEIIDYGELEINAFSITFWIDFKGDENISSVYLKIPKYIFYDKRINFTTPITASDRVLAKNEYDSLLYLSSNWDESEGVSFVKPITYIEEYNAILTERVFGSLLFKEYKKSDSLQKYKKENRDNVAKAMCNFGKSLRAFHSRSSSPSVFKANQVLSKIDLYIEFLKEQGVNVSFFNTLSNVINHYKDFEHPSYDVDNLKGIDIRQIFLSDKGNLFVIDPGKITKGYREIDLARFIVTCRIIYWGTSKVLIRVNPDKSYENHFIHEYYDGNKPESTALSILIIKEFFKQWKVSHSALLERNWSFVIKYLTKKLYIDPYFKWQISNELKELKKRV